MVILLRAPKEHMLTSRIQFNRRSDDKPLCLSCTNFKLENNLYGDHLQVIFDDGNLCIFVDILRSHLF
jgi:hypothetical protein